MAIKLECAKNLGALRGIGLNLLKTDPSDTRSQPKKRRRAMLDLTYRDSLLSLILRGILEIDIPESDGKLLRNLSRIISPS